MAQDERQSVDAIEGGSSWRIRIMPTRTAQVLPANCCARHISGLHPREQIYVLTDLFRQLVLPRKIRDDTEERSISLKMGAELVD